MGIWIGIGISIAVSTVISLIWVKALTDYYESGQYEKDKKDGLYDDERFR